MNVPASSPSPRPSFPVASRRPVRVFAATLVLLAFAGCSLLPTPGPDPTRHYVLTGPAPEAVNAGLARGTLKVGVRSVSVAPYLDGKAMIVRRGDNEIDYREYARWAEPLSIGVGRMLQSRLLTSERVARVFPQPFPFDVVRDVDVAVTVLRCEGEVRSDGSAAASFVCAVEVTRAQEARGGGEVLLRETFVANPTPWTEGDHAGLARALSDAVAQLADRVASALPAE